MERDPGYWAGPGVPTTYQETFIRERDPGYWAGPGRLTGLTTYQETFIRDRDPG